MTPCGLNRLVGLLTLIAYAITSVVGSPGCVVLCHGADGHVAIEPAHGPEGCSGGAHVESAADHQVDQASAPGCSDVLLLADLPQRQMRPASSIGPQIDGGATPCDRLDRSMDVAAISPPELNANGPALRAALGPIRSIVLLV